MFGFFFFFFVSCTTSFVFIALCKLFRLYSQSFSTNKYYITIFSVLMCLFVYIFENVCMWVCALRRRGNILWQVVTECTIYQFTKTPHFLLQQVYTWKQEMSLNDKLKELSINYVLSPIPVLTIPLIALHLNQLTRNFLKSNLTHHWRFDQFAFGLLVRSANGYVDKLTVQQLAF